MTVNYRSRARVQCETWIAGISNCVRSGNYEDAKFMRDRATVKVWAFCDIGLLTYNETAKQLERMNDAYFRDNPAAYH